MEQKSKDPPIVKKIARLENFGIFRDFTWDDQNPLTAEEKLPSFSTFNLIYGWNKSGKTTLSRVFAACEKKKEKNDLKDDAEDSNRKPIGKFKIEMNNGSFINESNYHNTTTQVRVFNRDFVEKNISFDPDSEKNSDLIIYVSEEDIATEKKLEQLQKEKNELLKNLTSAKNKVDQAETRKNEFLKSTAFSIKQTFRRSSIGGQYHDYNVKHIKSTLKNMEDNNSSMPSGENYEEQWKLLINSGRPSTYELFDKCDFALAEDANGSEFFFKVYNETSNLLETVTDSPTAIPRLKNDKELNNWVQSGYALHLEKNKKDQCLFCEQMFLKNFFSSLESHFNDDYKELLKSIQTSRDNLKKLKLDENKIKEKYQKLDSELQEACEIHVKKLHKVISETEKWLDYAVNLLKKKEKNLFTKIDDLKEPERFSTKYNDAIGEINTIIRQHNESVEDYDTKVEQVQKGFEKHLIIEATKERNYAKIRQDIKNEKDNKEVVEGELQTNTDTISVLEKKVSNIRGALEEINAHLEAFFGGEEISLVINDSESEKGYIIKRGKERADSLSESEKNAIAFAYFIAKTQEEGFNIKEGIIFIDDPISSFDSNFIYQCSSLIEYHFEEARQLIISTHNFEFFNRIKKWFKSNENQDSSAFFMIENIIKKDERHASIVPLDKTLREFESEYHFLFSRLKLIEKSTSDYAHLYTIENIARRFLEIYTNFKIPTTDNLKNKIQQLNIEGVSEVEKERVYRLIQESSHGGDPISIIQHKDKGEVKNAIKALMKMIENSDPRHFKGLEKICKDT